jgi:hypothetical protein
VDTTPRKTTNKHIFSEETNMVQRHDQDIWSNFRAVRKARILVFRKWQKPLFFSIVMPWEHFKSIGH